MNKTIVDNRRTRDQQLAIAVFDYFRVNSICFCGKWIWRQDIRNSPILASAFIERLRKFTSNDNQ